MTAGDDDCLISLCAVMLSEGVTLAVIVVIEVVIVVWEVVEEVIMLDDREVWLPIFSRINK